MRVTDAVVVDNTFRLWRKAVSIRNALQWREDWYRKNLSAAVLPKHEERLAAIREALEREIRAEKPGREINSSLSSRRCILSLPVRNVMQWVFENLPEPVARDLNDYEVALLERFEEGARAAKAARAKFLLGCEIAHKAKLGHYMIFNTLTVDNEHYWTVFKRDSTAFKDYVRAMQRRLRDHTYFAVLEEGDETGRLHIHIVHFTSELPAAAGDPNRYRTIPDYHEIDYFKPIWRYGNSTPIALRYSPEDAFGKAGWRWPIDLKTGETMVTGSPFRIASYMGKYVTKNHATKKRSKLQWRVRKTHHLGMFLLQKLCSAITTKSLWVMTTTDTMKATWNNWTIPPVLIRQVAMRTLSLRNHQNGFNTNEAYNSAVHLIARHATSRPTIVQPGMSLTQLTQTCSQQSSTFLSLIGCGDKDTFDNAHAEFIQAAAHIEREYFQRSLFEGGTTSNRDHIWSEGVQPTPVGQDGAGSATEYSGPNAASSVTGSRGPSQGNV